MKRSIKFLAAGAVAALLATTAFAAPQYDRGFNDRGDRSNNGDRSGDRQDRSGDHSYDRDRGDRGYRDNERVTMSGRITSLQRERDGYRVQLDRGRDSYWIPQSRLGRRARDLRVGISISLGGIFRGGMINVDAVTWPGNYGYNDGGYDRGYGYRDDGYLRGVVRRVDYRDGLMSLRDDETGRRVDVRMRDDLQGIRRGDFVTLEGHWERDGSFDATRIDDVR